MKPFFSQIERDLLIAWQSRQDIGVMLVFFVIIIALFPLAIGANATVLDPLGVPVIWIAALLAILAGFDQLFAQDVRDGWLAQISLGPAEASIALELRSLAEDIPVESCQRILVLSEMLCRRAAR